MAGLVQAIKDRMTGQECPQMEVIKMKKVKLTTGLIFGLVLGLYANGAQAVTHTPQADKEWRDIVRMAYTLSLKKFGVQGKMDTKINFENKHVVTSIYFDSPDGDEMMIRTEHEHGSRKMLRRQVCVFPPGETYRFCYDHDTRNYERSKINGRAEWDVIERGHLDERK